MWSRMVDSLCIGEETQGSGCGSNFEIKSQHLLEMIGKYKQSLNKMVIIRVEIQQRRLVFFSSFRKLPVQDL
jgi:hypothetical protein